MRACVGKMQGMERGEWKLTRGGCWERERERGR